MKKIVVIGGSNIDLIAKSYEPIIARDSNPGSITKSFGGVGRNIAENLARLGLEPTLLTVLGNDAGNFLLEAKDYGLKVYYQPVEFTPTYLALHQAAGELYVALSAMESIKKLTPSFLKKHHKTILDADILILESNIPEETLSYIFEIYGTKSIYVDLISTAKAQKFFPYLNRIHTIKINLMEGKKLTAHSEPVQIGQVLLNKGIQSIYLTLGKDGAYHFTQSSTNFYQKQVDGAILSDTGAGDAFYAGAIFAEIVDVDPLKAGTAMAHLNLKSHDTVSKNIKPSKIISMTKE